MFIGVILSGLITLIFISTPESLQVNVPDNIPTITTKSAQKREFDEAKKFFESSIKSKIPGASLAAVVSWSPNSKYILTDLRFADSASIRTKPYIFDLANKEYIEVPNTDWIDTASWAGSKVAYATESGFGVFDVATNTSETFGNSSENIDQPIISADGSYVAYADKGIMVYSLKASKSIRLTSNSEDVPALWKTDNKTILIYTASESKSAKATLVELHIGSRELTKITDLPQSPKRAQWVERDQLALFTLGHDDNSFDYTYDFSNDTLTLLAETSEGLAFTSTKDKEIATLKGNKISLYDNHAVKIAEAKRSEKSKVVNFSLVPSKSVFLIREKGKKYDSAIFNIDFAQETVLENLWLPYAIIAPNGKSAITVEEGNDAAHFIDIPVASS
ncbi:MAG: hypothetical protein RL641_578 [Candidatus Parcubacteria bacterium]|jgi:hypothetical protein